MSNITRFSEQYESEHGFKRCSSRPRLQRPMVSAFAADGPASCTRRCTNWPRRRWRRRAWQCRCFALVNTCPDSESLRGYLYNGGSVFQYAARAQALLQLLMCGSLLPTGSHENKALMTEALSTALTVCREQTLEGSVVNSSYDVQHSSTRGSITRRWTM